jgi:hypothetical protein
MPKQPATKNAKSKEDESSSESSVDEGQGILGRFQTIFGGLTQKVKQRSSKLSTLSHRAQKAKNARANALQERKAIHDQMKESRGSTFLEDEDHREHHNKHHHHHHHHVVVEPAAGEFAFAYNRDAIKVSNTAPIKQVGLGAQRISPITKMTAEKLQKFQEDQLKQQLEQEAIAASEPAPNLAVWYDAGLMRDSHGHLHPKRPLPYEYDYCPWSTPRVPQIQHHDTGLVIWPARFDLVPFFVHFEHSKDVAEMTTMTQYTTVYHYTSKASYSRIIAPPDIDESEVQEPYEHGEEIWDRIGEDLAHRQVHPIAGASHFSLAFVAQEPARFRSREEVACAAFRTNNARHHHMAVAYCVALMVPTDKVLAVGDANAEHTALVLAPGEEAPDDDIDIYDAQGHRKKGSKLKLVKWTMRTHFLRKSEEEKSTAEKVVGLELLDGLIDRDHVKEAEMKAKQRQEEAAAAKEASLHASRSAVNQDEEEDRLEAKLDELENEREFVLRKIRHAHRAKEKLEEGRDLHFLETDDYRIAKLNKQVEKVEADIEKVRADLRDFRSELEITINTGSGMAEEDGEQRKMRRRRRKKEDHTVFGDDCNNFVNQVADEYNKLAGNVFREVFGGHKQGVDDLLEAKGDPNLMDFSSGWMPLHMAAANGDIEIVAVLCKASAIPTCRSRDHGLTPMHLAVRKTNLPMVECLLTVGARAVREKAEDGATPLMLCVTSAPISVKNKMVGMLMEAHADANAERKDSWNPLSYAVHYEMKAICKMLVLHGGKVLGDMPGYPKGFTIWQAAGKHPHLQDVIKEKLNSRDLQQLERRFPGTIKRGGKDARKVFGD